MSIENTKIFKALSDNSRLRILKMLQSKSLCVCEVQDVLGLATSTVSKHLSVLREAGFIKEEKEGIHLITRADTKIPVKAQGWKNFND